MIFVQSAIWHGFVSIHGILQISIWRKWCNGQPLNLGVPYLEKPEGFGTQNMRLRHCEWFQTSYASHIGVLPMGLVDFLFVVHHSYLYVLVSWCRVTYSVRIHCKYCNQHPHMFKETTCLMIFSLNKLRFVCFGLYMSATDPVSGHTNMVTLQTRTFWFWTAC